MSTKIIVSLVKTSEVIVAQGPYLLNIHLASQETAERLRASAKTQKKVQFATLPQSVRFWINQVARENGVKIKRLVEKITVTEDCNV